jgi:hypothetical protein
MWGRFLDSKSGAERLSALQNGERPRKQLNAVVERARASAQTTCTSEPPPGQNLTAVASAAAMFLKPLRKTSNPPPPQLTLEQQLAALRASELALQRQLVRVAAGAEATQTIVDMLLAQNTALRIERESTRVVLRASMHAAEEIAADYLNAAAKAVVWRSIANASVAIGQAGMGKLEASSLRESGTLEMSIGNQGAMQGALDETLAVNATEQHAHAEPLKRQGGARGDEELKMQAGAEIQEDTRGVCEEHDPQVGAVVQEKSQVVTQSHTFEVEAHTQQ